MEGSAGLLEIASTLQGDAHAQAATLLEANTAAKRMAAQIAEVGHERHERHVVLWYGGDRVVGVVMHHAVGGHRVVAIVQ